MKRASHLLRTLVSPGGRVAFLAAAMLLLAGKPAVSQPTALADGQGSTRLEVASYLRPEVRLRKLHLVRPDLIQYPLVYDIVC